MTDVVEELREKVAASCRILAMEELAEETLGHVSARVPGSEEALMRCRGAEERGLIHTGKEAIRRVDFEGRGEELEGYRLPNEYPIHGEIYKQRPEVGCVVHVHPPVTLLCFVAGIPVRPVFGGYNPPALKMSLKGIPVYDRSITLTNARAVGPMLQVMGDKDICVLKGHGLIVTGRTVEEATIRAIQFEKLAKITWELAKVNRPVPDIAPEDIAYFTAPKSTRSAEGAPGGLREMPHEQWQWIYYLERLKERVRHDH